MADSKNPGSTVDQQPRYTPVRSGQDRRKVNVPPPPGSPVRSGLDRRQPRRSDVEPTKSQG